jgi:hypothetical protein
VGSRKPTWFLRRLLPLAAVAALGAPLAAAAAGDTRPDPAPHGAALAPDPAPTASRQVFVPPRTSGRTSFEAPVAPAASNPVATPVQRQVVKRPVVARQSRRPPSTRPKVRDAAPRNVTPLAVDTPRGLGTVVESIRRDSVPTLAALALLAAAAAAVSGAALVLTWSRQQGLVE